MVHSISTKGQTTKQSLNDIDGIKNTGLVGLNNNIVIPDLVWSLVIHYHMVFFTIANVASHDRIAIYISRMIGIIRLLLT
jgi:hypothetical protein